MERITLYDEHLQLILEMDDADAAQFIKAVAAFALEGREPQTEKGTALGYVWPLVKKSMIRDEQKRREQSNRQRDKALRRWHGDNGDNRES